MIPLDEPEKIFVIPFVEENQSLPHAAVVDMIILA
jgi:hypothetical protein